MHLSYVCVGACFLFPPCSYWANLKLWFKQKISKEEFDIEARRLLAQENGQCQRTALLCANV